MPMRTPIHKARALPLAASQLLLPTLLCLAALSLAGCGGDKAKADTPTAQTAPNPVAVSVAVIEPMAMRDVLTLPGDTEASEDVVLSAERGGRVEWIGPEEGERVRKGQLIAKIDLSALNASLRKAQASYELAKDQSERRKSLYGQAFISREELDKAETELRLAKSGLDEAQVAYDQGLVHSPIDGVVNELHVDPGEFVAEGAPVAEVVNTDIIDVRLGVPELDVRHLSMGQPVLVTVDAYPGQAWEGRITFLAYKASSSTRTFSTKVTVDNGDGRIRPGMIARASLQRRLVPDALGVPLFCLLDKGGERLVYIEENGIAKARTVRLGIIEADRIQVLEGLAAGDRIIISGQNMVEEGMRVVVR
ncbi:MAG: efflux RND transporter periplasmic adaptor subunit [Desulfocurvibacter africanus]